MGRYARQAIANIPYHIINRGNNHQPIFFCDDDYWFFLEAIELAKEKYPCRIYSFVLMTNHIHLLLESIEESENLAYFMKHITQRHGQYINRHCKDPPAERVALSLPIKGDENASCPQFYLKQALLFTFGLPLFCFLIFHITADLIVIQTNSINTVTTLPKMIPPIRFLFQFSVVSS
jgi:REP element-mobilizing transposase RayT